MILQGDCREVMRTLPEKSVQCVITSPPYWGLRDYGSADQLGLEPTPEQYVSNMVEVFREVRRVLRDDGTVWLNLGDSYASQPAGNFGPDMPKPADGGAYRTNKPRMNYGYLKPKDLVGIPWRVAFALQADGWWLRSDIIWAKPNPMPESVTDRPTRSHEYVFLLTKSARYYYDADAIREPQDPATLARYMKPWNGNTNVGSPGGGEMYGNLHKYFEKTQEEVDSLPGRNKRTVWDIATQPYAEAHFATFPEALVKPCLQAGTSERGCCAECGAPWERVVEREGGDTETETRPKAAGQAGYGSSTSTLSLSGNGSKEWAERGTHTQTLGWRPTCAHEAETVPCVVLDPFGGSGTVGVVAKRSGRSYILIDASEEYCRLAEKRIGPQGVLL